LKILEVRDNGVNVKLELPKEFIHERTHPVFHVEKLKRYTPSSIKWPGRVQPPRPTPVIEKGKQWWVKSIIGKKEQEVLERVLIPADDDVKEILEPQDSEEEEKVVEPLVQPSRRISPRLHSSARDPQAEAPKPQQTKRGKYRFEKRMKFFYLVQWEVSDNEVDSSWEPEDHLIEQGLQAFITDYEERHLAMNDQLELGLMSVFKAMAVRE
jgi:hypothetical protein